MIESRRYSSLPPGACSEEVIAASLHPQNEGSCRRRSSSMCSRHEVKPMSDRETDRLRASRASGNADYRDGNAMGSDDASAAAYDETELSDEQLDGVSGGASTMYKKSTEEDSL